MGHKRQRDIPAQVEIQCSYCHHSPVSGGLKRTRAPEEGRMAPALLAQFNSLFKTIYSVFLAKLDSGRLIEQTHLLYLSTTFKAHHEWRKKREKTEKKSCCWVSFGGNGFWRQTCDHYCGCWSLKKGLSDMSNVLSYVMIFNCRLLC